MGIKVRFEDDKLLGYGDIPESDEKDIDNETDTEDRKVKEQEIEINGSSYSISFEDL